MAIVTRTVPLSRRLVGAVVSALAVAIGAVAVTIFLFFIALLMGSNGADGSVFLSLWQYFAVTTLVVFIVMIIMALVGVYSRWYLALIAGLVAGVLGSLIDDFLRVINGGAPVDATNVLEPLFATYFPFELLVIVAAITAGIIVYRRITGDTFVAGEKRIAIVRAPAANLADGEVTHIKRTKVDTELADQQWDAYVSALSDNGWDVVEVPVGEGLADSVFIEDAVVVFGNTAVITSPGAESRRGETVAVEATVRGLGLRPQHITLPGTLDGGDVLTVGTTVYVGRGGRTNADGIRQLRGILAPLGYDVVAVPSTKALHLKSTVTALPDGTIIGWPAVVEEPGLFGRFLAMPEEAGAHVVVLGPDTVLVAASAPKSAALLSDLGYLVVTVDISEFEKLEGCVTCLSVLVR
jgi:dimethylargininase